MTTPIPTDVNGINIYTLVNNGGPSAVSGVADLASDGLSDNYTLQVNTSGTVTGPSIQLQGSLDGVNWTNLGSAVTAPGATKIVGATPAQQPACRFFQVTVNAFTGGGTVTVILGTVPLA